MILFNLLLSSIFTIVQLNCENLFDCKDDILKNDEEFLPQSYKHWTEKRYWRKLNMIGQEIIACGEDSTGWKLPDLVGLCEVENDSVMRDLTKRSLLRKAKYEYVMTQSEDERGIDVALLYSPFTFSVIQKYAMQVPYIQGMKPTRDILYVEGKVRNGETMHVFVVHAPSRRGGEYHTHPYRVQVAKRLISAVDSIRSIQKDANIILMGDFNDSGNAPALSLLEKHSLVDISKNIIGRNGAKGTYRYQGQWENLDHIFVSHTIHRCLKECYVFDADYLLEEDKEYGSKRPKRSYMGAKYIGGYSDHLPIIARFMW